MLYRLSSIFYQLKQLQLLVLHQEVFLLDQCMKWLFYLLILIVQLHYRLPQNHAVDLR